MTSLVRLPRSHWRECPPGSGNQHARLAAGRLPVGRTRSDAERAALDSSRETDACCLVSVCDQPPGGCAAPSVLPQRPNSVNFLAPRSTTIVQLSNGRVVVLQTLVNHLYPSLNRMTRSLLRPGRDPSSHKWSGVPYPVRTSVSLLLIGIRCAVDWSGDTP